LVELRRWAFRYYYSFWFVLFIV